MSVQAISWALGVEAGGPGAKCVLLALANYADENGECWPSQQTIAKQTEMSVRTLRDRLNDLVEAGLIERRKRGNTHGRQGRASDYYALQMASTGKACRKTEPIYRQPDVAFNGNCSPHIEPSEEPSITVANATVHERKTDLVWKTSPEQLLSLGLSERAARSNLGRWLKDAKPDRVLEAVDAAYRVGTKDPIAYVTAALKPKGVQRDGDDWLLYPGTEEFEVWHKQFHIENSPRVYDCQSAEREGAPIRVNSRWPQRAA